MRIAGNAVAVVMAVILAACGVPDTGTPHTVAPTTGMPAPTTPPAADAAAELSAAQRLWSEMGPESYTYQLVDDCGECDPSMRLPQRVVVWSGQATGRDQPTIQSLFADIDEALSQGREVAVTYDPTLGHPTDIGFDMQDRAFDGGYHLLVQGLSPGLPGSEVAVDGLETARALWQTSRPDGYEFTMSIHCDCDIAGTIWTRVEEDRIVDWEVEFAEEPGTQISPITVDVMFDDLAEMFSLVDGVVTDGVRFTGSAEYDAVLGYPTWVGLDIEVLDPTSDLAVLPPRLIFSIDDFTAVDGGSGPTAAEDLVEARGLWDESGLTSYSYELRIHDIVNASFSEAYVVTISDDVVASVESAVGTADTIPPTANTIDALFDLIGEALAKGETVEALYHHDLGYPVFVAIRDPDDPSAPMAFSIHNLVEHQ